MELKDIKQERLLIVGAPVGQARLLLVPPVAASTLMSLVIDLIRRLDSSDSKIIPSIPLYSSKATYAPISAIDLTCTITTSSTSGYLDSYIRISGADMVLCCCTTQAR